MLTQLSLPFGARTRRPPAGGGRDVLVHGRRQWPVTFVRNRRARHYVLRVEDDGSLRVTIPRSGSREDAERFAKHKAAWIDRERYRRAMVRAETAWGDGDAVLLRGEAHRLTVDPAARTVRVGDLEIPFAGDGGETVHAVVTTRLRELAERELSARLLELAASLGHRVARVAVGDPRSQWGSCSPAGRISLHWRLVQVPPPVRDYVILHELTHLVEANHSRRFWKRLNDVCPWHREARAWLRAAFSGSMSDPWPPPTRRDLTGADASAPPLSSSRSSPA